MSDYVNQKHQPLQGLYVNRRKELSSVLGSEIEEKFGCDPRSFSFPEFEIVPHLAEFGIHKIYFLIHRNSVMSRKNKRSSLFGRCKRCRQVIQYIASVFPNELDDFVEKEEILPEFILSDITTFTKSQNNTVDIEIVGVTLAEGDNNPENLQGEIESKYPHFSYSVNAGSTTITDTSIPKEEREQLFELIKFFRDKTNQNTVKEGLKEILSSNVHKYWYVFNLACDLADHSMWNKYDDKVIRDLVSYFFAASCKRVTTTGDVGQTIIKWPGRMLLSTLKSCASCEKKSFVSKMRSVLDPKTHGVKTAPGKEETDKMFEEIMRGTSFTRVVPKNPLLLNETSVADLPYENYMTVCQLVKYCTQIGIEVFISSIEGISPFNLWEIEGEGSKVMGGYTGVFDNGNKMPLTMVKVLNVVHLNKTKHGIDGYCFVLDSTYDRPGFGLWADRLPSEFREMFCRSLEPYVKQVKEQGKKLVNSDNRSFCMFPESGNKKGSLVQPFIVAISSTIHDCHWFTVEKYGERELNTTTMMNEDERNEYLKERVREMAEEKRIEKEEKKKKITCIIKEERDCPVCLESLPFATFSSAQCGHCCCKNCFPKLETCFMCRKKIETLTTVLDKVKKGETVY